VKHFASAEFWACLEKLPANAQQLARENYELLKANPYHPSLHFKRVDSGPFVSAARTGRSRSTLQTVSSGFGSAHTRNTIASSVDRVPLAVA
jgi:hypothetical protein